MKSDLKYKFQNFKYCLDTQKFKIIFIFSLVATIYGISTFAFNTDYANGFINILDAYFYILIFLLIILINTLNTYNIYTSNKFYIMRFNTRRQFFSDLIKGICFNNFMVIIMNLILVIIGLNIFNSNTSLNAVNSQGIYIWGYLIYKIFKFIVILEIISIINAILLFIFGNKLVFILNLFMAILIVWVPYNQNGIIDSFTKVPLFIWQYFFSYRYSNFPFEIVSFILYIIIIIIMVKILFNIIIKYTRKIGV